MKHRKGSEIDAGTTPKRVNVRVKKHLTPTEVAALIKAARAKSRYPDRDAALIVLTYEHGLRVSELCSLRWDQVDWKAATLAVERLKNGIDGLHPLTGRALRALRPLQGAGLPWIFTTERGGPMTPAGVRDILRRLAPRAGLKRANPHSLRHACGYALVNQGSDIRLVQAYLGHRDIRNTVIYTEIDARRFRGLKF